MTRKRPAVTSGNRAPGEEPWPMVSEEAVVAYLCRDPDLLVRRSELLESLALPSRSNGNVVDMQHMLVLRLREEIAQLNDAYSDVIAVARSNRLLQKQFHTAVTQLMAAASFEKLIHTATADLPLTLDVDVVTICLESGNIPIPRSFSAGLRCLPDRSVDALLGPDQDIVLATDIKGIKAIFGPAADLVRSQALARLTVGAHTPKGLLAIGSRDPMAFRDHHATELVGFLTSVLEATIRRWLCLPA